MLITPLMSTLHQKNRYPRRGRKLQYTQTVMMLILTIRRTDIPEGDGNFIKLVRYKFLGKLEEPISPKGTETLKISSHASSLLVIRRTDIPEGDGNVIPALSQVFPSYQKNRYPRRGRKLICIRQTDNVTNQKNRYPRRGRKLFGFPPSKIFSNHQKNRYPRRGRKLSQYLITLQRSSDQKNRYPRRGRKRKQSCIIRILIIIRRTDIPEGDGNPQLCRVLQLPYRNQKNRYPRRGRESRTRR